MKILYELPKREKDLVQDINQDILYCTPFDLSILGYFVDGWFIVYKDFYIKIEDGKIVEKENHIKGSSYKLINHVGNGVIEIKSNDYERIIVRFSMLYVSKYTYISKILETLSKGQTPKIISDDNENKCSKCGKLYESGTKVCRNCTNKKAAIKRLASIVKPYNAKLIISIIIFWLITGLSLINPVIYRVLIDDYLIDKVKDIPMILILILAIAFSTLIRTLFTVIKNRLMIKVGSGIAKDLRKIVYAKIQSLSIGYLDNKKTGELMNRVTGDTRRIQRFISYQFSFGVSQILTLIVVSIVIFLLNWKLAFLILVPIPFVLWFLKYRSKTFIKMYHNQWKLADKSNSILHDILSGIRVVKAFGMEKREVSRFSKVSMKLANTTAKNEKVYNTIFPFLNFMMGIGRYLLLYFGGILILNQQFQIGELIQFTSYVGLIYGPLGWLTFFPKSLTDAITASERIFEILDEEPLIKDDLEFANHIIQGNVDLNNITFGYKYYEPVLKNISLDVRTGEMIGLVGHSGAGKSTLINLIMRLYDVDEGKIFIDGKDIKSIKQNDLRSQMGVVLQETFLFSGTILQNITYAKPKARLEDVLKAAKIANAHDFVMKFPDGYDTLVGERGQRLSGGEKQRIAIARAILHNPKILILDEATASVDTETEYEIQEALSRLIKNRTTFAIAHRLSTLRNATRLLVIDKGKKIELGTHQELMKAKGKYYSLVMAQSEINRTKGA